MNRSRSVYHEWFSIVSDALPASAEAMRRSIAYLITVWQRSCPAAHVITLLHRISCRGAQHFMHIRERLIQRCSLGAVVCAETTVCADIDGDVVFLYHITDAQHVGPRPDGTERGHALMARDDRRQHVLMQQGLDAFVEVRQHAMPPRAHFGAFAAGLLRLHGIEGEQVRDQAASALRTYYLVLMRLCRAPQMRGRRVGVCGGVSQCTHRRKRLARGGRMDVPASACGMQRQP